MKYVLTPAITTMGILIVFASTQVSAESSHKSEEVSCQTKTECKQLAQALEVQIDVFKNRGMSNLSRAEKIQYMSLKKQLLSTQDKIIAKEREITAKQDKIIAKQDKIIGKQRKITAKQDKIIAEEREKQEAIKRINDKLNQIEDALKK